MQLAVVQSPRKAGADLMAEDRALLEQAECGAIGPTLRFYEWQEPTISLGFHQREEILDFDRMDEAGMPWVRRPTGGAAVLHSEELTYAIVIPDVTGRDAANRIQELVSRAIALGLRALGVAAETEARGEPLSGIPDRNSCFVRTSRWEVTARGRKIVGSAQRRLSHALLQHGSILLGDDHLRIADFLRLADSSQREMLRDRLRLRSTFVAAEIGACPPTEEIRSVLAASFLKTFSGVSMEHRQATETSLDGS